MGENRTNIESLQTENVVVRIDGDTAVVTGNADSLSKQYANKQTALAALFTNSL